MTLDVPRAELILGGQKSGKSRTAEARAAAWIARPGRTATLVATALAADDEMAARIARHRADRAARVPGLRTHEAPHDLAAAIESMSSPEHLLVVDCVTLWLSQRAMPPSSSPAPARAPMDADGARHDARMAGVPLDAACGRLVAAVRRARGPLVLVSNEIGLGVVAVSPDVRAVVDVLGRLHQDLAAVCDRVTLMVAGCEVPVKRAPAGDANGRGR